ncbi:MAG: YegP family protein [Gammaproteobacteria bacterium]|nr:YegP family protein [Gammaproteobacteria bacterium]MDH4314264.1 YegP family protein [Gammaproteobacteria bacterium]MDH5213649.1 YegP family protein [Gammaproteobacteria bacterium]
MAGKFELYKDKAGKFRFRLKAANGENILSSEAYEAKTSCKNGIDSVIRNSTDPKRFVKKSSGTGKFSFNLTASNNQVIGTSQSYSSESGCDGGIKSVGKAASGAKIDDQT